MYYVAAEIYLKCQNVIMLIRNEQIANGYDLTRF